MTNPVIIRDARSGDLPGILKILNHYVLHDHCTFDTEPWSIAQKQSWFDAFGEDTPYRLLVAEGVSGVNGYAHSNPWRPKRAYEVTAETTVYVSPEARGRGLGKALLEHLLESLRDTRVRRVVAGIAQPNEASNHLHQNLGYNKVGCFHRVGHKFGQDWDVTWFERDVHVSSENP